MHAQGPPSILVTVLILALIAWRLYARSRRLIGKQRLNKWRLWVTVTVFPLIFVVLAVLFRHFPPALWALAGGAIAGLILGVIGLKLTKFETTPTGPSYTPSAHLGIALSALLVLRIGYRFIQTSQSINSAPPPPGSASSQITLLIFGALALYYVTYAIGLIRWSQRITTNTDPTQPAEAKG